MLVSFSLIQNSHTTSSNVNPDHCIDLLRQVLMCNSDIGLIFYTDRGNRQPDARVSTTHTCRNFSAITEWVNKHDSAQGIHVGIPTNA